MSDILYAKNLSDAYNAATDVMEPSIEKFIKKIFAPYCSVLLDCPEKSLEVAKRVASVTLINAMIKSHIAIRSVGTKLAEVEPRSAPGTASTTLLKVWYAGLRANRSRRTR